MYGKPQNKRLLFIIDNLSTGGAQRQLINLALGLTERGYEVQIFCYAAGDLLARPLYAAGIMVHWNKKSGRFSPGIIFKLKQLINSQHFDLILAFLTTPNFYALLAGRLLQTKRIPVIVSERRCDLPQGPSNLERFARQFYRLATRVVTNSHHQKTTLAQRYPWLRNRISTIYNGHDLSIFTPIKEEPDNHPIHILSIASVSPYKNGLCLVEALNILRQRDHLTPQVDWIGEHGTSGESLNYLNRMNQAIQSYHLGSQWHWLFQRTDIVDQLHQHDVLVHPSFGEGLPNVVCEALACARPVIVSDVLDHSRIVQHGESGYLFDYQNPSDLADKLKMFIGHSLDDRFKMGQSGRKFAQANLSSSRFIDEYEQLFINSFA
jgi:GalNAc-alpha-(1->4)-GalNAc-alpha-(1->3)-diNAcBac-PP-undecaprenol alpha-1,4-N-acetyl-D-galactosaminyltransferase